MNVYKIEIKIICVDFYKRKNSRSYGKEVIEFFYFYKNIAFSKNEKKKEEIQKYRKEIKEDKDYISLIEKDNYEINVSTSYNEFKKQYNLEKIDKFISLLFMDLKDLFQEIY